MKPNISNNTNTSTKRAFTFKTIRVYEYTIFYVCSSRLDTARSSLSSVRQRYRRLIIFYFILWVPRKFRRLISDQRIVCLSPRSRTRMIAYNFNHNVEKKKILHYSNVTCAARPGEYKRVRACAVAAARATPPLHFPPTPQTPQSDPLSDARRSPPLLSIRRTPTKRLYQHAYYTRCFIYTYVYRYNMHTTVVVFVTIIITITFVKIDV